MIGGAGDVLRDRSRPRRRRSRASSMADEQGAVAVRFGEGWPPPWRPAGRARPPRRRCPRRQSIGVRGVRSHRRQHGEREPGNQRRRSCPSSGRSRDELQPFDGDRHHLRVRLVGDHPGALYIFISAPVRVILPSGKIISLRSRRTRWNHGPFRLYGDCTGSTGTVSTAASIGLTHHLAACAGMDGEAGLSGR